MQLTSFSFAELEGTDRAWSVSEFKLEQVNLFVGRNAAGKSRLLNCMSALAAFIVRPPPKLWSSGSWQCLFEHDEQHWELNVSIRDGAVESESLVVDGRLKVRRAIDGRGAMWAEKAGLDLDFKVPPSSLVIASRRDEVQHPYLEPLYKWADSVRRYAFGSEFGKGMIYAAPLDLPESTVSDETVQAIDPEKVVELYLNGWRRFGADFDADILKDFAKVGYDCEGITCAPFEWGDLGIQVPNQVMLGRMPLALYVKERDLPGYTRQVEMSMGMYRALALIINLNFTIRSGQHASILIDDIGEGLDYERSMALIKLLIMKCNRKRLQLIMSTNDRFVMNEVDLRYWHIVHRNSNKVRILDYENSRDKFDQFKFIGLSNFDFFSREAYLDAKA